MHSDYFEQLHRDEARHAEWYMLDQSLAASSKPQGCRLHQARTALGGWLVQVGKRLAGQNTPCYCIATTNCEEARH